VLPDLVMAPPVPNDVVALRGKFPRRPGASTAPAAACFDRLAYLAPAQLLVPCRSPKVELAQWLYRMFAVAEARLLVTAVGSMGTALSHWARLLLSASHRAVVGSGCGFVS
jgi:hypothetical protein